MCERLKELMSVRTEGVNVSNIVIRQVMVCPATDYR